MRKQGMGKGMLCWLLAFCLAFGMSLPAFAAEVIKEPALKYVSLGASNVNGYGMRGYISEAEMEAAELDAGAKARANVLGYMVEAPGAYPTLVAEELGAELDQLAISSMRAEELRILLDDDYYGDSYSAWRFLGEGNWFEIAEQGGLSALRDAYQGKIAEADVVTVDIGVNNFGVYISYQMSSDYALENDVYTIDPALGEKCDKAIAFIHQLVAQYAPGASSSLLAEDEFIDTLAYALVGFCVNFDASIERIYELNPDAKVVVVSIQNLMEGLDMAAGDGSTIPLGDLFGALINTANAYISMGSPYSDEYIRANLLSDGRVEFFIDDLVAYDGDPKSLSQNVIDCFNVYDGDPGDSYDSGLHVKYALHKYLEGNGIEVETLSDEQYEAALYTSYDVVASVLQAAALNDIIDLGSLDSMGRVEDVLMQALAAEVFAAADAALVSGLVDYALPEDFFENVASAAGVSVDTVMSIATIATRISLGNSFFGHPNPAGHEELCEAIITALDLGTTGKQAMLDGLIAATEKIVNLIAESKGGEGNVELSTGYDATHGELLMNDELRYLSLGDSNATGVGLKFRKGELPYGDLVAEALGLDDSQFVDMAMDNLRTEDLHYLLDESVEIDEYAASEVFADVDVASLRAKLKKEIEAADFITLSTGSDNLSTFVFNQLWAVVNSGAAYEMDWALHVGEENVPYVEGVLEQVGAYLSEAGIPADLAGFAMPLIEAYAYGYAGFALNYSKVVEDIQAINPNAEIALVGLFNGLGDLVVDMDGKQLPLGEYASYFVDLASTQCAIYASSCADDVTFVSVPETDVFLDTEGELSIVALLKELLASDDAEGFRATAKGHAYIADQIMAAMTLITAGNQAIYTADATAVPEVTATVSGDPAKFSVAADCVEVGETTATISGYGYAIKVPLTIEHYATVDLFEDFKQGHWYLDENQGSFNGLKTLYMDYALATGVMGGYKNADGSVTKFGPWDSLDRAQAAVIIYRMAVEDASATIDPTKYADNETPLSDVQDGMYYTAAVNWCVENGVITGYQSGANKGKFKPYSKVTRQELAVMIERFVTACAEESFRLEDVWLVGDYDDAGKVADWAAGSLNFCLITKVMSGVGGTNNLNPTGTANRAEAAKMFSVAGHNLLN